MSNLLINEYPIAFLPTLAVHMGVDGALVLQQVHYWTSNPKIGKVADGQRWVRNSLKEWRADNFPFWSESKISRVLTGLEEKGVLMSRDDLNTNGYDRTKWYSVHYGNLQNCKMHLAELQDRSCGNDGTIPETTTETTTESAGAASGTFYSGGIFAIYENVFGMIHSKAISDRLTDDIATYGETAVIEALTAAQTAGVKNYKWVETRLAGRAAAAQKETAVADVWAPIFRYIQGNAQWDGLPAVAQATIKHLGGQSVVRGVREGYDLENMKRRAISYAQQQQWNNG